MGHFTRRLITQRSIEIIKAVQLGESFRQIEDRIESCVEDIMEDEQQKLLEESNTIEESEIPRHECIDQNGLRRFNLKTCNYQGVMIDESEGFWVPFNDVVTIYGAK